MNSRGGGKDKHLLFFSAFLSLSHIKLSCCFFFFKPRTDDYTANNWFKLCTRDYRRTILLEDRISPS